MDNINEQAKNNIRILKRNKREYTVKQIVGGVTGGALLVGFIATKATDNVANPGALAIDDYVKYSMDYLNKAFMSLRGVSSTPFWEFVKPENGLEYTLATLFAGTAIWQAVQSHKRKKTKKEIQDIEMGR